MGVLGVFQLAAEARCTTNDKYSLGSALHSVFSYRVQQKISFYFITKISLEMQLRRVWPTVIHVHVRVSVAVLGYVMHAEERYCCT